ncbi:unnamed protein product, partial [Discosporangium mesarthrocarpum]
IIRIFTNGIIYWSQERYAENEDANKTVAICKHLRGYCRSLCLENLDLRGNPEDEDMEGLLKMGLPQDPEAEHLRHCPLTYAERNRDRKIRYAMARETPMDGLRHLAKKFMNHFKTRPEFMGRFWPPVDFTALPDYKNVCEKPMWMELVWELVGDEKEDGSAEDTEGRHYKLHGEFIDDVRLIFENCIVYNGTSEDKISQQWAKFARQFLTDCNQMVQQSLTMNIVETVGRQEILTRLNEAHRLAMEEQFHRQCAENMEQHRKEQEEMERMAAAEEEEEEEDEAEEEMMAEEHIRRQVAQRIEEHRKTEQDKIRGIKERAKLSEDVAAMSAHHQQAVQQSMELAHVWGKQDFWPPALARKQITGGNSSSGGARGFSDIRAPTTAGLAKGSGPRAPWAVKLDALKASSSHPTSARPHWGKLEDEPAARGQPAIAGATTAAMLQRGLSSRSTHEPRGMSLKGDNGVGKSWGGGSMQAPQPFIAGQAPALKRGPSASTGVRVGVGTGAGTGARARAGASPLFKMDLKKGPVMKKANKGTSLGNHRPSWRRPWKVAGKRADKPTQERWGSVPQAQATQGAAPYQPAPVAPHAAKGPGSTGGPPEEPDWPLCRNKAGAGPLGSDGDSSPADDMVAKMTFQVGETHYVLPTDGLTGVQAEAALAAAKRAARAGGPSAVSTPIAGYGAGAGAGIGSCGSKPVVVSLTTVKAWWDKENGGTAATFGGKGVGSVGPEHMAVAGAGGKGNEDPPGAMEVQEEEGSGRKPEGDLGTWPLHPPPSSVPPGLGSAQGRAVVNSSDLSLASEGWVNRSNRVDVSQESLLRPRGWARVAFARSCFLNQLFWEGGLVQTTVRLRPDAKAGGGDESSVSPDLVFDHTSDGKGGMTIRAFGAEVMLFSCTARAAVAADAAEVAAEPEEPAGGGEALFAPAFPEEPLTAANMQDLQQRARELDDLILQHMRGGEAGIRELEYHNELLWAWRQLRGLLDPEQGFLFSEGLGGSWVRARLNRNPEQDGLPEMVIQVIAPAGMVAKEWAVREKAVRGASDGGNSNASTSSNTSSNSEAMDVDADTNLKAGAGAEVG